MFDGACLHVCVCPLNIYCILKPKHKQLQNTCSKLNLSLLVLKMCDMSWNVSVLDSYLQKIYFISIYIIEFIIHIFSSVQLWMDEKWTQRVSTCTLCWQTSCSGVVPLSHGRTRRSCYFIISRYWSKLKVNSWYYSGIICAQRFLYFISLFLSLLHVKLHRSGREVQDTVLCAVICPEDVG